MANFNSVIIDHLNLGVINIEASMDFYSKVLAPLGKRSFLIYLLIKQILNVE